MHSVPRMPVPVLQLVSRFWVGGSERQFIERLRAHPEGYTPIVACLEMSGGNLDEFLQLKLPAPAVFPLKGSLLQPNTLIQVARLARLIRKRGARLVHGTEFISNFVGLLAARLAGVPVIVSRVDLGHLREGFGEKHRAVEKWMSRNADAVSANAEAVKRLCIDEEGSAPGRTFVIPNGLDLERFDELAKRPLEGPLPDGHPLIAVVANLWPVKGHRALLAAIATVRRERPGARFVLVGDGPERAWLEANAGPETAFLGTRYDVPAILSRCDAFCLPSLAEGLPNAVMEAMAAGLPVVASAVGGVPELVGPDNGFLAEPGDANSLSTQLLRLLSDRRRASDLGAQGRHKIERDFSLRRLAERHRALYDALSVHQRADVGMHPSSP
jgi:glycosyltransferase involved in cell wall biosynthesis